MSASTTTAPPPSSSPPPLPASDEERRKLLKPNVTATDVMNTLTNFFAFPPIPSPSSSTLPSPTPSPPKILKALDSYDDQNFLVEINSTRYLLKVHNGVESDNELIIDYQNSIMVHLNKTPSLTTSNPIPPPPSSAPRAQDGLSIKVELPVLSAPHSPYNLTVRLLTFIEGTPMNFKSVTPQLLCSAGNYLATIDSSLDKFEHKGAHRYHAWDGKNTCDLRSYTQYIQTDARRAMVNDIIDTFEREALVDESMFRKGILQSDFNDANIIIGHDDKMGGVIDFGDSVYSWRVLDCTVAMAYAMLCTYGKTAHSLSAAACFLRGYNSLYPLTEVERKHVRLLVACRLAASATIGAFSYAQDKANTYLLLHAEPCWAAMELLWSTVDSELVEDMFTLACSTPGGSDNDNFVNDLCVPDPSTVDVFSSIRLAKRQKTASASAFEMSSKPLTFVTGNAKKLEEVTAILSGSRQIVLTSKKVDLPELQGDPLEIAKEKCLLAVKEIDGPVITEDTSLCFNALNGMPGPYIKWFLEKCGHEGLNSMLGGFADKTSYAQTVVAYCGGNGQEVHLFDGRTAGTVVAARGQNAFGWDPIFQCEEGGEGSKGVTYAEMDKDAKNVISHRGKAFRLLKEFLEQR